MGFSMLERIGGTCLKGSREQSGLSSEQISGFSFKSESRGSRGFSLVLECSLIARSVMLAGLSHVFRPQSWSHLEPFRVSGALYQAVSLGHLILRPVL